MAFTFRRAVRENVPLIIGLAGGTGSGKTFSAMRLAKGLSGGKPFAVIDTEAGRAKHYAEVFEFDHGDLAAPFHPDHYTEAIVAADKAGYPVIVVDSVSHIWAGEGGVLDWQEEELTRMAGDNWQKRESCKMAAWIKPKMAHKQFIQRLLQLRAHLILCLRAEAKIEMTRDSNGKMQVTEKQSPTGLHGWLPIAEKTLPYELTLSFLLMADKPGIPQPIKLQEQHRGAFDLTKPITEDTGRKLAKWAAGGTKKEEGKPPQPAPTVDPAVTAAAPSTLPPPGQVVIPATEAQVNAVLDLLLIVPQPEKTIALWTKGQKWETLSFDRIGWCIEQLNRKRAQQEAP